MNYSIRYFKNSRNLKTADEIIIKYKHKTADLVRFIQEHPDQKIVANILEVEDNLEDSLEIFRAAASASKNFEVMASFQYQMNFVMDLAEANIKYFFAEDADTWDKMLGYIYAGATQVYITNELGFEIGDVSTVCHKHGVKVRVYPNIAQSSSTWDGLETIKKFFIRPEDLDFYENVIDTVEMFGSLEAQDTLIDIYKEKVWKDKLKYIILGLKTDIYNNAIVPWVQRRMNCRKKCTQNKCGWCSNIENMAKVIKEKDWEINFEDKQKAITRFNNDGDKQTSIYDDFLSKTKGVSEDFSNR